MSVPVPARLSPSSWADYEKCPRAWRLRYIDGIKGPPTVDTEVGSFVHRVLELVMQMGPPRRTLDVARVIAAQVWAEPGDIDLSTAPERVFKRRAWNAICGWSRTVKFPDKVKVEATEQRIEWTLGKVPMVAVVDLVERNSAALLEVDDYKSGRYRKDYQAKPKRQIAVGALAVASLAGYDQIAPSGRVLYVTEETVVKAPTDPLALAETTAAAEATWFEITEACRTETFEPTTGPLCAYCSHVPVCPEGQSQVRRMVNNPHRPPPPADAAGVVALAAVEAEREAA